MTTPANSKACKDAKIAEATAATALVAAREALIGFVAAAAVTAAAIPPLATAAALATTAAAAQLGFDPVCDGLAVAADDALAAAVAANATADTAVTTATTALSVAKVAAVACTGAVTVACT